MNTQNFNNNIGLDTLKLYVEGKLKTTAINSGLVSFNLSSNSELNKQFQNTEQDEIIQCNGFRHKENKKFQVNFHNGNCTIQASVPKINNMPYELLGIKENKLAYEYLKDTLSEFYEFKEADIKNSRLDITRNIELEKPMQAYNTILSAIPSKYKGYNFMNTHTSFNGSQAHCIYDKPQEILDKKEAVPEHWLNKNIARNEIRLLKGSKLKQLSNTLKVNLLEPKVYLQQDKFIKLQNFYIEHNKQFFKYANNILNKDLEKNINFVQHLKNKGLTMLQIEKVLGTSLIPLETLALILFPNCKVQRSRYKANRKKLLDYAYSSNIINFDYRVLLEELKHKTLMQVA